jgi:hypothetical protein
VRDHGAGHVEEAAEVGVEELVVIGVCDLYGGDGGWIYPGTVEDVIDAGRMLRGGFFDPS